MTMLRNKLYVYADKKVTVPADLNYGGYMLEKFREYKDNDALTNPNTGESLTYTDVAQLVVDVALSLVHLGVRKGDVVAICSEERLEYYPTAVGIISAGAICTYIVSTGSATIESQAKLAKPKVVFIADHAYKAYKDIFVSNGTTPKFVVYTDEEHVGATTFKNFLTQHADVEDFIPFRVNGALDTAVIFFSSGTTGVPKGIMHTHWNILQELNALGDSSYFKGKIVLAPIVFQQMSLFFLGAGAHTIFIPGKMETVDDDLRYIETYKVQILMQMPSIIFDMAHYDNLQKFDVSSVEFIMTGASPLKSSVVEVIKRRFPNVKRVCQYYGCTEVSQICRDDHLPIQKPDSVGRPYSCNLKVVDSETDKPLGPYQRGEIRVQTTTLSKGYISNDPNVKLSIDDEGFYRTGDIGYYDDDHYFYLVDRKSDVIKYDGFQISPHELEAVLLQHPAVLNSGVVGLPDDRTFEVATAFVVLQPGATVTADELTAFVNKQLPDCMQLAGGVRFVTSLPRGGRGKLDRKALKRM